MEMKETWTLSRSGSLAQDHRGLAGLVLATARNVGGTKGGERARRRESGRQEQPAQGRRSAIEHTSPARAATYDYGCTARTPSVRSCNRPPHRQPAAAPHPRPRTDCLPARQALGDGAEGGRGERRAASERVSRQFCRPVSCSRSLPSVQTHIPHRT